METQVKKRNGKTEGYKKEKIINAMQKAFAEESPATEEELQKLLQRVEELIGIAEGTANAEEICADVEDIQDHVERALMEAGYYSIAKRYIIYRERRKGLRLSRLNLTSALHIPRIESCLMEIQQDFPEKEYDLSLLDAKYMSFCKDSMTPEEEMTSLIKAAVELTDAGAPQWEKIAARLLYHRFRLTLSQEEARCGIRNLYEKISYLTDQGLYGSYILSHYSKEELLACAAFIDEERNKLYTYAGLDLLLSRYVIHDRRHVALESPQEMFLGIAMHLAMEEKENRKLWVKRFYDMLSLHQVTMATPTLSNARKPYHQLSSCFIDTVPDSLDGIYRSIDSFAQVSKFGGGMGMYFGKVRATGGSIRGFEGAAGGVIRWIRLVNDTAVAVDQLGMRQGAVAVYLDVWHKDIPEFLQLRTNNGDDRMKAHDVFPAVCYPDLFWKMAKEDMEQSWYMIDPHEVFTIKGFHLEDYYGEEWEKRYRECIQDNRIIKREVKIKELIRLILKSAVETGTPFAFYRDTVNRANPNGHEGIIYCSNLCTEIAQNMTATELVSREVRVAGGDGAKETVVVTTTKPGDFVVCNLASLNLGRIDTDNEEELGTITRYAMRALDNVIDLNFYPTPYAELTNKRYRSVGLGVSGYHHMLAKRKIAWESEEHLTYADRVFEQIAYAAVDASSENAKEKGSYAHFEGSDWQTGAFFEKRGYTSGRWKALAEKVKRTGMRNAYLVAVAPTSSTSILVGTSAGLDPIMHRFFLEEKKGYMLPRVAPDLNMETYWYYKSAHTVDQSWTIRAAGVRQRHIDQAQSVNLYITNEFSLRQVLSLYLGAWEAGVKTLYYVRSKSLEVEECESCAS
ncbi:MAG: ribonucleoside-diphosphate reductase subunit alpha [Lachnospiraceae bacterium]|nr:ribonucleoside-diphosphate reductase subunit alpha [Lachnospiraceae bacterium]